MILADRSLIIRGLRFEFDAVSPSPKLLSTLPSRWNSKSSSLPPRWNSKSSSLLLPMPVKDFTCSLVNEEFTSEGLDARFSFNNMSSSSK
ncbi:hypothetical protein BS78_05G164300 [Paspalum vaginatum]|nr:hypothetical protein BS78_05G164300 [Paspalum vaginatum]